jgi:serine/threonine protein kinase
MNRELEGSMAQELSGIDRANVVMTFRHGVLCDGGFFIDMELCDLTLEKYMNNHWPAPPNPNEIQYSPQDTIDFAWSVMKDFTAGLKSIHNAKHVHRDLKPENGFAW